MKRMLSGLVAVLAGFGLQAEPVSPMDIEFSRKAVRRLVFDQDQLIPLSTLDPTKVVHLDVEYPAVELTDVKSRYQFGSGTLKISASENSESARWVGGFNPYATYDVHVKEAMGESPAVGVELATPDNQNRLILLAKFTNGECKTVQYRLVVDGKERDTRDINLKRPVTGPFTLRLQMMGVGFNVFIEKDGVNQALATIDCVEAIDLRRKENIRRFEFRLLSRLGTEESVVIDRVASHINPGMGQGDLCVITNKDGSPLLDQGRLWITITIRGGGIAHPMQGVYSLNPSVFDLKFEGMIVFDRGDGLLRNELASHIFYDEDADEWRGLTTGFSALGDPGGGSPKMILSVSSKKDPRFGFSVMKAKPVEIPNGAEDPHIIFDKEDKKWRVLMCSKGGAGFPATLYEANEWDGPYELKSGPASVNGTGCLLQKIGSKYYAIFGSADRKFYVYSYPDLEEVGALNMSRPPWVDGMNTRVWPNVIPLPDGYPAPYISLSMDRVNYPSINGWVYGALYFYHGYPKDGEREVYEYEE